jgi:Uma2 family endonuclease
MGMPAEITEWTAEMARALPDDGNRYEVLDGELFVTPAPTLLHQRALRVVFELLLPYVSDHAIGELLWSPADIEFSPKRLVQPDLFVAELRDGGISWRDVIGLILAIEGLSRSTAYADRHRKRRIYMEEAVDEYWIVDVEARVIERWRKGDTRPEILDESLVWTPIPGIDPLIIYLHAYFTAVHGGQSSP